MARPQISTSRTFWQPPHHTSRMPTIDITNLAPNASIDLGRLQLFGLPEPPLSASYQQQHQQQPTPGESSSTPDDAFFGAYPPSTELQQAAAASIHDQNAGLPTIFEPKQQTHDLSPTSSTSHTSSASSLGISSERERSSVSSVSCASAASFSNSVTAQEFYATRSRVVRLYNLPALAESFLAQVFLPHNVSPAQRSQQAPVPATMWELKDAVLAGRPREGIWAVFRTHSEASAALSLSGRAMSVAPALESDLEPFHKLHRVLLPSRKAHTLYLPPPPALRVSASLSDLQSADASHMLDATADYTLSSNPPNPKTTFRLGDWICAAPNCVAHNFGRNLSCIGCGCPRSTPSSNTKGNHGLPAHQHQQQLYQQANAHAQAATRAMPSPRFNVSNAPSNVTYYSSAPVPQGHQRQSIPQHQHQQHVTIQHPTIGYSQPPRPSPSPFSAVPSSSLPHIAIGHPSGHTTANPHIHTTHANPTQPSVHASSQPGSGPSGSTNGNGNGNSNGSFTLVGSGASSSTNNGPGKPPHPLLTPSGRAFAVGGKVQNISSDPLSPCIMYWPDNEPFPEQGQIRPNNLVGSAPPILNTGNRGPISHQPGDWICQKCNYLNWRRRKVCQTCLPYAEGNGDSISAAVQAERIALLTSVLSQTQISASGPSSNNLDLSNANPNPLPPSINGQQQQHLNVPHPSAQTPRSHSLTPPQVRRPFIDLSAPATLGSNNAHRPVHRSRSHFALGQQYGSGNGSGSGSGVAANGGGLHAHFNASSPIYQTSGRRQPSPLYSTGPDVLQLRGGGNGAQNHGGGSANGTATNLSGFSNVAKVVHTPAPLLPSFLQDIVQSPALSPTSTTTSSADLSSVEEYDDLAAHTQQQRYSQQYPRARGDSGSSADQLSIGLGAGAGAGIGGNGGMIISREALVNIWRLDGEESKNLTAFALPNHEELLGARRVSREGLRGLV